MTDATFNLDNIDLGSLAKQDVEDNIAQDAKATQSVAINQNPDEYARALKMAQQAGVPLESVQSNPQQVETDLKLNEINFDEMSKRSPNTTKFISDYDNAVVAQEDISLLERLERIFNFDKTFENFGETTKLGFQKQGEGLLLWGADNTPDRREDLIPWSALPLQIQDHAPMLSIELAENMGIHSDEELAEAKEEAIKQGIAEIRRIKEEIQTLTPEDLNTLEQGVRGGTESLVQMAPGVAATVLTRGKTAPMLFSAGAQTFAGSYAEGREGGLDADQATFYASVDAGIEVLTELLPTKTIEGVLKGQFKGKLTKGALQFAVREMSTEQLATLGQSLNAYAFDLDEQLKQATSLEEMIDIQLQRQAVTAVATIVAGGAQTAGFTGVRKTLDYMAQRNQNVEQQTNQEQQFIDDLNQMSSASKMRERDAERFKQFIEKNDGNKNTQIYIDGAQLQLYLNSLQVEDDPAISLLREHAAEASALGGDAAIPVSDFATYIAGSDHFTNLREFMSLTPETNAPFRQEQAREETQRYMEDLVAQAQENVSEYVEAQEIFENARDQLIDSGAYSPQVAAAMAQVVPAWATVYARDNGISIQEAYQRAGLKIVGPQTGRAAELQQVPPVEPSAEQVVARVSEPQADRRRTAVEPNVEERQADRRQDTARRERIASMSAEDQYKAIYGNELTGLNNRRAFEEDVANAPVVASIDADSLKTVNDNLGQDAGDNMLRTVAQALNAEFGPQAYHISGDEFYVLGDDQVAINDGLTRVREALRGQSIASERGEFTNADITWGMANEKNAADLEMKAEKKRREEAGERAPRGETLPGTLKLKSEGEQFQQRVEMHSAVERAVVDMNLPQWKKGASARGKDVWAKIKSTGGLKKEELDWLGLEQFLTVDPDAKFTREEVTTYVSENGVQVEEVIADESKPEGGEFSWDTEVDDSRENWDHRVEDHLYDFDNGETDFYFFEIDAWLKNNIDDVLANYETSLPSDQFEELQELDSYYEQIEYLEENGYDVRDDMRSEMRDDFEQEAEKAAEEEYMENPYTRYRDSDTEIEIFGNDDLGYQIIYNGEVQGDPVYSFSEAEVQAQNEAFERDLWADEQDENVVKWEDYVTDGAYDNYREIKLTLPEMESDFYNDVHFPDRNLLAFLRVSDRDLQDKNTFFIEEFQSDWHQQGRQKGYSLGEDAGELDAQANQIRDELRNKSQTLRDDIVENRTTNETFQATRLLFKSTGATDISVAIEKLVNGEFKDKSQSKQVFEAVKNSPELLELAELQEKIKGFTAQASAERYGVPDAPFKGDAWMTLGLKRALVHAAENGYEAVAWPNAEVLKARWSDRYAKLYETQYDTKMTSQVKKLTKQKPEQFSLENDEPVQHQELGYHIIEMTPQLRDRILNDGFTLFQDTRGYYEPANSMIRLTEAANLSTFLHEFAHFMYEMELKSGATQKVEAINNWFKKNSKDVAKEATGYLKKGEPDFTQPAPQDITEIDVHEFLAANTTGNQAKDAAIREAVHEQFARGFEAYLMEGKAPSTELRNVFAQFARWLAQIYQTIRGSLRVNLDDQIRDVFDRMLATEEQLQAARARQQYEPMFTDAAMAGMTEGEFAKYQERQQKAKAKESETLRDKLIKEITRQTQSWWKREKADIVDEQLVSLRNQPVYRASESLKGETIKLDHATVKEMVGEQVTDKRGRTSTRIPAKLRGMTVTGAKGVHPDEAAAFFGFNSGDEMIQEIISAPTIKQSAESNAEQIMRDRHGDMLNDGTIEQQADEALQNEERGELILSELRTLARQHNTPTLDRQTIKTMAEENIAKLSFRQIHPGKYRKAEIRAAQEAASMLAAGNTEGAMQAKSRQVMNYYLGMAATNAKNETVKIVDRMARYNKKSVKESVMKAGEDYWSQIVTILERFEFRKSATLQQVNKVNQDINTWMREKIDQEGDGLVLSPAVLNESYVTHWKNVSFSDLKGIEDSVKNIEHVARYANKLTRMGEEIEFKKLVDNWVTKMNEQDSRFTAQRTDVTRGRNWGRWAMAQMTKIPWMASWLDGGERVGISHQIMVQPFTDAYDAELKLWKEVGNKVMQAIENRDRATRKRHNRKIHIPAIKDEKNDGNLYGHQVIAVALNTGNQGNLRKMLLGEGWAQQDDDASISIDNPKLQAVLEHMTKEDWEMVQLIWDQMDALYPQLAETHRRTTGLTPPKVEATPVETPYGKFRGGYYPVKYDSNRSHQAMMNEDRMNAEVDSMFNTIGSIQASVNAGATNERTKYFAPIRLSLDVVPDHFQEVIHYITHHDAVREVNKLIRNQQVAETIKAKLGPEEYAQLRPWLNDIAKDGRGAPTKMFWDTMLQRLRFGTTLGVMGFKASTGIIQISGLSNSIAEVGLAPVLQSARGILGSPSKMKSAWEFASENSKVLNHRTQTMDREIKNAMSQLQNKRGILAAVQEVSMKHIALIQTYMVDLPTWHAAYIKSMKEYGDEQRAYQYADWVVENVQGSGATKDLARIMRNQTETGRMFTMFMTFFSSLWNTQRDLVKGARGGRYSITTIAAKGMFLITIPVLFEMMMRGELGADEDEGETEEEALQRALTKVAVYPVQSIPFVRDIVNASTGDYGYNISPIAGLLEQGTQTIPEIATRSFTDEEITEGQVKGATKFVGAAAGIPGTSQAWATGEHLYDVLVEGEEFTMREFLFGPERK